MEEDSARITRDRRIPKKNVNAIVEIHQQSLDPQNGSEQIIPAEMDMPTRNAARLLFSPGVSTLGREFSTIKAEIMIAIMHTTTPVSFICRVPPLIENAAAHETR